MARAGPADILDGRTDQRTGTVAPAPLVNRKAFSPLKVLSANPALGGDCLMSFIAAAVSG